MRFFFSPFLQAVDQDTDGDGRLIVDLTGVGFLGSGGIHVLFDHLDRLGAVLVNPRGIAVRALSIVGFPCLVVVPVDRPSRIEGPRLADRSGAAQ